jgi:hypothetical protein
MKVTYSFLSSINTSIRVAKIAYKENEMRQYIENITEVYGMIKGLYMMNFIDDMRFSFLSDKIWKLTEFIESDFKFNEDQ